MTDDNTDETTESLDENAVADVDAALEETGAVEPEADGEDGEDGEESRVSGVADRLMSMSGTGKDLDSYENDPIASVVDPSDGEETHRGAKHIARGVDGLSPVTAAHPLIDIAVGFVLISADSESDGAVFGGSDDGEDGESAYSKEDGGEMLS